MSEYKTTKVPVELYRLRTSVGEGWANIYLYCFDDAEKGAGELVINSDYGSWAYSWYRCSKPFKHFLAHLTDDGDTDYLMKKLNNGEPKEINFDATKEAIINDVNEQHAYLLEDYKVVDERNREDFGKLLKSIENDKEELKQFFREDWEEENTMLRLITYEYFNLFQSVFGSDWESIPIIREYSNGLKTFVEKVWPVFAEELKKELNDSSR